MGSLRYSAGSYTVKGVHPYAEEGPYPISVTLHHDSATDVVVTSSATVSDPAVVATGGFIFSATEGSLSTSQTVATFIDPAGAESLTDYSASIAWGDSSTSSGTITFASGIFTVKGAHTYAEEGNYLITVTVHHDSASDSTATSSASVSDPSVVATGGFSFSATEASLSTAQPVATFTDPGGAEAVGNYSASVNWGDTATSTGSISVSGGTFTVSGSHNYAEEGSFTITVTISHESALTASATSTATAADAALTAGTLTLQTTFVNTSTSLSLGFSDADPYGTVSD